MVWYEYFENNVTPKSNDPIYLEYMEIVDALFPEEIQIR